MDQPNPLDEPDSNSESEAEAGPPSPRRATRLDAARLELDALWAMKGTLPTSAAAPPDGGPASESDPAGDRDATGEHDAPGDGDQSS